MTTTALSPVLLVAAGLSCVPLRDLDEAASQPRDAAPYHDVSMSGESTLGSVDSSMGGDSFSGASTPDGAGIAADVGGSRDDQGDSTVDGAGVAISLEAGPEPMGSEVATEVGVVSLPDLPNDLPNSPVTGTITYDVASWQVDGGAQATYEIRTPTASYTVMQATGSIISILDGAADQRQWIDYSDGFRPLRGVPGFSALPPMTTVLDDASQTLTHLRLLCQSKAPNWSWVWDFYLTHVTMTVIRTPGPYGFGYRGVPGGLLDVGDDLVSSSGTVQSALNSFYGDLPGPAEWSYLVDTTLGRSLFLVQHGDDSLPDRYQVKDSDSAMFLFGDGMITQTPLRFSLGLIDSGTFETVKGRVAFVVAAIH